MDHEFLVFQLKLLASMTPNVPLADNLRVMMAPALAILRDMCDARLAIHVFINEEIREAHAMVVGQSAHTADALFQEMVRRHDQKVEGSSSYGLKLPEYVRLQFSTSAEAEICKRDAGDEYQESLGGRLERFLTTLHGHSERLRSEFGGHGPRRGDTVLVLPLGSLPYARLGFFILWSPQTGLKASVENMVLRERRAAFRGGIAQLMIRVFTTFYRMEPHTYLPSFCQPATKKVTLLCVEMWNFEGIARVLKLRHDLDHSQQVACLRSLVNRFTRAAAEIVEQHRGRTDQMWGSGLLAVFGEYLDTPGFSERPGCMRAVTAGAEMVSAIRDEIQSWLQKEFLLSEHTLHNAEYIKIAPVVAIDHGEVNFDYVGSHKHRVYMLFGDRVDFVKSLAAMAGTSRFSSLGDLAVAQHDAPLAIAPGESEGPPILLSGSAHKLASEILRDRPGAKVGEAGRGRIVRSSGERDYIVYPLFPENVERLARATP